MPVWIGNAICLLFAAGLLLLFATRAVLLDWPAWLVLLNSFAPCLFVPLPFAFAWALLRRSKAAWIGSGLMLALFAVLYGSLFLPRPSGSIADDAVTIMTFNLGPGVGTAQQVMAAIAAENADLVVVQELWPDTAEAILRNLGDRYPYRVMDAGASGRGVLSRYPITDVQWIQTSNVERATLALQWLPPGHVVRLFAPHPNPPNITWLSGWLIPVGLDTTEQERQLLDIVRRTKQVQGTVLMMGDFNLTDQTRAYANLSAALRDVYREAGWGFGFSFPNGVHAGHLAPNPLGIESIPVPGPLFRLDYIFHSDDMQAQQVRLGCGRFSDHCYLVARLSWR